MTHTNVEQSKQLIEMGINENTADFTITENGYLLFHISGAKRGKREYPCWSTEALLSMLPTTIYNEDDNTTHKLIINKLIKSKEEEDTYLVKYRSLYNGLEEFTAMGDLLQITFKAVKWLLTNNLL